MDSRGRLFWVALAALAATGACTSVSGSGFSNQQTARTDESRNQEFTRIEANNRRFTSYYGRTASGCASIANQQQGVSTRAINNLSERSAPVGAGTLRRQHARNHQYAAAVSCLFNELDVLLPLPPPETWPGFVGQSGNDVATHVACHHQRAVPPHLVADLAAARQWWSATATRLASTADVDVGAAFDVWDDLNDPSYLPSTDRAWPFYSASNRAWLMFNPDDRTFAVSTPTVEDVATYCQTLP